MKLYKSIALIALTEIAAVHSAGFDGIPACAVNCFTEAVGNSSCSLLDFYCQCTTGAEKISKAAIPCICKDSTCTHADLMKVEKASDKICSSALSVSSQTYTPTPLPSHVCKAVANSTGAASNSASLTASAASASSTSGNAAAPTNAGGVLGYGRTILGMAGAALLVL